jgi:hypothetical protein
LQIRLHSIHAQTPETCVRILETPLVRFAKKNRRGIVTRDRRGHIRFIRSGEHRQKLGTAASIDGRKKLSANFRIHCSHGVTVLALRACKAGSRGAKWRAQWRGEHSQRSQQSKGDRSCGPFPRLNRAFHTRHFTPKPFPSQKNLVGLARFELATTGLGNRCSIHLSYSPVLLYYITFCV